MNEIKALLNMGMPELHEAGFSIEGAGLAGRFGRTPKLYKGGGKGGGSAPAPAVPATPAPAAPVVPLIGQEDTARRRDQTALQQSRGRSALRIDRTAPSTGVSGSGLNIPS